MTFKKKHQHLQQVFNENAAPLRQSEMVWLNHSGSAVVEEVSTRYGEREKREYSSVPSSFYFGEKTKFESFEKICNSSLNYFTSFDLI